MPSSYQVVLWKQESFVVLRPLQSEFFRILLGRLLRRAILALGVIFCFRAVPLELKAAQQFKRVARWPTTQAVIRSSAVYTTSYSWSGKGNRFCPILGYGYSVQTHTYIGSNSVFDFVCWPDAYDFVAQHKPGAFVTIAYDP